MGTELRPSRATTSQRGESRLDSATVVPTEVVWGRSEAGDVV